MNTRVIFLNDLHVGHPFAIMPQYYELEDGNRIYPNRLQETIYRHFCDSLDFMCQKPVDRNVVILVGDLVEGKHHDSVQALSVTVDAMIRGSIGLIEDFLRRINFDNKRDVIKFIAGTSAHDGPNGTSARRVAEHFSASIAWRGLYSIDGILFDVAHKPGSGLGSRIWTRGNAFSAWARSVYYGNLEHGMPVPRFLIRADRHVFYCDDILDADGKTRMTAVLLPPWKAKDEYVYNLMPEALSRIGFYWVDIVNGVPSQNFRILRVIQDDIEVI